EATGNSQRRRGHQPESRCGDQPESGDGHQPEGRRARCGLRQVGSGSDRRAKEFWIENRRLENGGVEKHQPQGPTPQNQKQQRAKGRGGSERVDPHGAADSDPVAAIAAIELGGDARLAALVRRFLQARVYQRTLALELVDMARGRSWSWDARRLAVLMLEQ